MLTCQEINALVTAYMEGEMPFMQRLRFRMHVSMCRHCRAFLRQVRATRKLAGALPPPPMPDEVRDTLAHRLASMRKTRKPDDDRPV